jgi:hypothetical protein
MTCAKRHDMNPFLYFKRRFRELEVLRIEHEKREYKHELDRLCTFIGPNGEPIENPNTARRRELCAQYNARKFFWMKPLLTREERLAKLEEECRRYFVTGKR